MKFMLILNSPKDGYEQYAAWPKDLLQAHMAFMRAFTSKLSESGELVGCEGLASPTQAKLVRAGKDGKPITDGVFPESKEYLAGYWIIDVDSPARACEIAAEASTAPGIPVRGADGKSIEHLWVEVREILSGAPV